MVVQRGFSLSYLNTLYISLVLTGMVLQIHQKYFLSFKGYSIQVTFTGGERDNTVERVPKAG